MTNRAEQNKQELIDRVAERVNQRLDKDRAKLAEQFARLLYSNIPPDDIKEESADNLYGAALSLLNFADQRKAGTAKVRVYNPRIEEQGWRSSHTIVEINTDDMPFLVDSVTPNPSCMWRSPSSRPNGTTRSGTAWRRSWPTCGWRWPTGSRCASVAGR
jgi:glutamate dehydrogenase